MSELDKEYQRIVSDEPEKKPVYWPTDPDCKTVKMPLGKYKGWFIYQIGDLSYLQWFRNNVNDLSREVKITLDRRIMKLTAKAPGSAVRARNGRHKGTFKKR